MGEHGFTPGPWVLMEHGSERYIISETDRDADGDLKMICDLFRGGYSYDDAPDAPRANAQLMAASPTLLEALEAYVTAYDAGTGTIHVNDQIRAAIALATGKDR